MEIKFKKNLTTLRRAKNLSQEQLAEKLDVSRQSVGKWESGEAYPEMKMLLQICDFFGVSLEDLVHGEVGAPDHNLRRQYEKVFAHRARFIATGVASSILGVAFLLGLLAILGSENETVAIAGAAIMMLFIAIGASVATYNALQKGKFDLARYNLEHSKEYLAKNRKIGMISGIIMMSATAVFLLLGFFCEAWNIAWIIFPICGIACGIIFVAMHHGEEN